KLFIQERFSPSVAENLLMKIPLVILLFMFSFSFFQFVYFPYINPALKETRESIPCKKKANLVNYL
ncbi:MAG: hypothetical protein EBS19_13825, partial [Spirochaetia bacterium]|nr:hypothetical protein [Spirochaetia bacterium]